MDLYYDNDQLNWHSGSDYEHGDFPYGEDGMG
jgi:hypothetical protein